MKRSPFSSSLWGRGQTWGAGSGGVGKRHQNPTAPSFRSNFTFPDCSRLVLNLLHIHSSTSIQTHIHLVLSLCEGMPGVQRVGLDEISTLSKLGEEWCKHKGRFLNTRFQPPASRVGTKGGKSTNSKAGRRRRGNSTEQQLLLRDSRVHVSANLRHHHNTG